MKHQRSRDPADQEILLAIKLVKFYVWESSFAQQVSESFTSLAASLAKSFPIDMDHHAWSVARLMRPKSSPCSQVRRKEVGSMSRAALIKTFNLCLVFAVPPVVFLLVAATYVFAYRPLDAVFAFTVDMHILPSPGCIQMLLLHIAAKLAAISPCNRHMKADGAKVYLGDTLFICCSLLWDLLEDQKYPLPVYASNKLKALMAVTRLQHYLLLEEGDNQGTSETVEASFVSEIVKEKDAQFVYGDDKNGFKLSIPKLSVLPGEMLFVCKYLCPAATWQLPGSYLLECANLVPGRQEQRIPGHPQEHAPGAGREDCGRQMFLRTSNPMDSGRCSYVPETHGLRQRIEVRAVDSGEGSDRGIR
eukprot:1154832-Pelagomonas_calceolata.AAC.5